MIEPWAGVALFLIVALGWVLVEAIDQINKRLDRLEYLAQGERTRTAAGKLEMDKHMADILARRFEDRERMAGIKPDDSDRA